ncbi:hypothetical protein J6590_007434 [Homalodisca vitripennis]|nr:hypothetical protein J6590_007434 [Homalodisca vitripennis]
MMSRSVRAETRSRAKDDIKRVMQVVDKEEGSPGENVRFRDGVKWIRVEEFGFYFFKESYDPNTPFKKVNIKRYVNQETGAQDIVIPRLFNKTGELSKEKKDNLFDQLPFIPEEVVLFHDHQWMIKWVNNKGPDRR